MADAAGGVAQLELVDGDGRRLSVVWSRSGKSIGVNVEVSRSWGLRFASLGLVRDQLDKFARFLRDDIDARLSRIELPDPHGEGQLLGLWNHQSNRVALTIDPSTPWDGDLPAVTLTRDQAAALADFLSRDH